MTAPRPLSVRLFALLAVALLVAVLSPPVGSDFGRCQAAEEAADSPATIRIKAGSDQEFTDHEGNKWRPDQGFEGGETIARADDLEIKNTKDPELYRSERYSMESFSQPLTNGKYKVRLHFAETFEEISEPGQRVFSFNVEGQDFPDFDVTEKAKGVQTAYVEEVDVGVTDGKLDITFTPKMQNPMINGIEIIPEGA
ncbi:MAG: malectin [Pirellulales bacterium]